MMEYTRTQKISPNLNYDEKSFKRAMADFSIEVNNGRALGELIDNDTMNLHVSLSDVTHRITRVSYNTSISSITVYAEILDTPRGKMLQESISNGVEYDFRLRVMGHTEDKSISNITIVAIDMYKRSSLDELQKESQRLATLLQKQNNVYNAARKKFEADTLDTHNEINSIENSLTNIEEIIRYRKKEEETNKKNERNEIVNKCIGTFVANKLTEISNKYDTVLTEKLLTRIKNIDYISTVDFWVDAKISTRMDGDKIAIELEILPWSDNPYTYTYYIVDDKISDDNFFAYLSIDFRTLCDIM